MMGQVVIQVRKYVVDGFEFCPCVNYHITAIDWSYTVHFIRQLYKYGNSLDEHFLFRASCLLHAFVSYLRNTELHGSKAAVRSNLMELLELPTDEPFPTPENFATFKMVQELPENVYVVRIRRACL